MRSRLLEAVDLECELRKCGGCEKKIYYAFEVPKSDELRRNTSVNAEELVVD